MPKYTLVYFNVRARAEVSRLLFAQAGVEYEDRRITGEEFAAFKNDPEKCPLGQLPLLLIEGHGPLPQSHAIERHLARTFGMFGKDEVETARIDCICESVVDVWSTAIKMHFEKDEAKKAEMANDFIGKGSVPYFNGLVRRLKNNSEGGKGYLVGDKMTLADLATFSLSSQLFTTFPVLAAKYPLLKEFNDRMSAEPKIAAWLEKRPKTDI